MRNLLIAGGVGAVGIGAYTLLKGDKPKEGADPAAKNGGKPGEPGATPTAGAPGEPGAVPTAGTPGEAGAVPPAGMPGAGGLPGAGAPGGGAPADAGPGASVQGGGDALPPGAQQVGPYTVIPDPQSGTQIVFETATRQPVGVLDAQGNLQPISVGADGKVTVGQPTPSTAPVGNSPMPGAGGLMPTAPGSPMGPTSPTGLTAPGGAPQPQPGASQSQYAQVAAALFAKAGDGTVGSAASDAMSGAGEIVPTPTPTPTTSIATPTSGVSSVAPQPATTGPGTPPASTGGLPPGSQQVGPYTIIPDPQSGANIVFDTATKQPLGVLDQQGKLVPIEALRGGAGASTGGAPAGGMGPSGPAAASGPAPAAGSNGFQRVDAALGNAADHAIASGGVVSSGNPTPEGQRAIDAYRSVSAGQ